MQNQTTFKEVFPKCCLIIGMSILTFGCSKVEYNESKKTNEHTKITLACDPNCSFDQRLIEQYQLYADNYIDKSKDSDWVIEQKQKFILDSLPKDYDWKTNPAKDRNFSGIDIKNGLGFLWTEYQLGNDLRYINTFTRQMYNQNGDLMGWEKNLLIDTKNHHVLGIDDIVKSPQAKAEIVDLVVKSSVGNIIKSNCYACKSEAEKANATVKKSQEILEKNWSLALHCKSAVNQPLNFMVCLAKGGNSSQTIIVGGCYQLENQQAKKLLKPEFLQYEKVITGTNYCLSSSRY